MSHINLQGSGEAEISEATMGHSNYSLGPMLSSNSEIQGNKSGLTTAYYNYFWALNVKMITVYVGSRTFPTQ